MRKLIFMTLVAVFVLGMASAAYADHVGGWGDPDLPPWSSPPCEVCHGAVEDGFGLVTHTSSRPQSLTLRNIIRFRNLYTLKVMKVEPSHGQESTPALDLGGLGPDNPGMGSFWTRVFSNAPYNETYNWTDFSDGAQVIPWDRMSVTVVDDAIGTAVANGGQHPAAGNHPPTNPSNWERVDVNVQTLWTDPVGSNPWSNTLDIVVSQI